LPNVASTQFESSAVPIAAAVRGLRAGPPLAPPHAHHFKLLKNSTRFRKSCLLSTWRSSSGMALSPRWRSLRSGFLSLSRPSSGEFSSISSAVSLFSSPA